MRQNSSRIIGGVHSVQHILAAEQFDQADLAELFTAAEDFRDTDQTISDRREVMDRHRGRLMLSMFYEPSTRTRFSFEIAAKKLGMEVVGTENAAEFSSAAKGETIEDTINVFNEYGVDAVSLRTKEDGHAARAASVSNMPILNGGDGKGEHPTQAALDMFTIQDELGRLEDLKVVIGGDLQYGRTARSLAQLISKYSGNQIAFVSTPELQIGSDIKARLTEDGTPFEETSEMYDALREADVVYWTRLQLERHTTAPTVPELGEYVLDAAARGTTDDFLRNWVNEKLAQHEVKEVSVDQSKFILGPAALEVLPKDAIIMHPLPRQSEIPVTTDDDPRAKYFKQAGNGLYVRMAMLDSLMQNRP